MPVFLGVFFMFIFYCTLIMKGSNRKIEAAIEKFQTEHNKAYEVKVT